MRWLHSFADFSVWLWPLLANHLWQTTLFATFALAAGALLDKGPARARQYVWLMASLKLAVPSFALIAVTGLAGLDRSVVFKTVRPAYRLAADPRAVDRVAAPFAGPRDPVSRGGSVHDVRSEASSLLTLVWLAGSLATAGSWCRRRRVVSRAVTSGRALFAGREVSMLARAEKRAGVTITGSLVVSREIEQPGVHGVLRPVVVLPEGIAERLSDAELESVFVHELVHVRRRDNLIGNLHMVLCCLFWFYPIVWLLDRRLLVERERVCDDEVLWLSDSPGVYVSCLLKVCQFCLGPRVAGVSAAAGIGMRDRVARIVALRRRTSLTLSHRALVGTAAVGFTLFVAAGLLGLDGAAPFASAPAPTAARGSAASGMTSERVDRTPPVAISFENVAGAPVVIRSAAVRIVPLDSSDVSGGGREDLVTPPTLDLENATDRRVAFVRVEFGFESRWNDAVGFPMAIGPNGSALLQPDWRSWSNTVRAGEAGKLVTRVVGVRFENGDTWGSFEGGPHAAAAPHAAGYAARFENPPGAPVIIVDARTDPTPPPGGDGQSRLPVVTLANTTRQRVTHLKLRFKANSPAHAVSAFAADIPPGGTYVFRSDHWFDGDPARMHVQLLGVRLEDGSIWGAFDTTIDTRESTVSVPQYIHRPDD